MKPPFERGKDKGGPAGTLRVGLVNVGLWADEPGLIGVTFGTRANVTAAPLPESEARDAAVVYLRQVAADAERAALMIERGGPV